VGQVINFNSLANDVGVSAVTLKEWLSVLEASFIIFRLQPYYENFGKRAIKSPKIYFNDTGLLAYLLGIDSVKIIGRDPLIGNIFENLVILEIIKARFNQGLDPNIYFFRDSNGLEIDVIYKQGSQLISIEIKSAATFTKSFAKSIHKFQKLTSNAQKGYVVYSGEFKAGTETYTIIDFLEVNTLFDGQ
jgi:predicted AAA+ superfamily ATPase